MNTTRTPSRTFRFLTAGLFALALATSVASAESGAAAPAASEDKGGACATERQKFCADVKPGGGARLRCLMAHEKDLGPECKAHVEHMKARSQEVTAACSDDAEKLCKGVESGKGRVIKCLAEHESALTPDCKGEVEKAKAKHAEVQKKVDEKQQAAQDACAPDVAKFCAKVEKGQGRIVKCLKEHEKEIAPACKAALP
ncbi:MAG: hypothetical protein IPK07_05675 [Deltaproteobacteria bacterium]|nr:hypothetical protein [Deltaproteobacteria bacterium]